jgi:protein disulfide-isomerase
MPLTVWHEDFSKALEESAQTGKPILADFTGSDWCHWCVKLKEDVFETDVFEQWARENVVLLELDYPRRGIQDSEIKKQNTELKERYEISSYPTVLFLDQRGTVLGKMGYVNNPSEWISSVEKQLKMQMVRTGKSAGRIESKNSNLQ